MNVYRIELDAGFTLLSLLIFSILLALGNWNPFAPISNIQDEEGGFGLFQIYSVLFVGYLFVTQFSVHKELKFQSWKKYVVGLYLVLLLSTVYWSINEMTLATGIFFLKFFLSISLCFLLPELFIRNKKYLYYSIAIFSISCALIALFFSLGLLDDYTMISNGRVTVFGENANSTSGRITIGFIFLLYLIVRNPLEWGKKRYFLVLLFFPMLMMIMASGSRGSFIILCFCVMLFLFLNPSESKVKKYLFLMCCLLIMGWGIVKIEASHSDFSLFERLEASLHGESGGREALNEYALRIFEDYPLIGKGTIGFTAEMKNRFHEARTVHNLYLYVLATSGVLGFILLMSFLLSLFTKALRVVKKEHLALVVFVFIFLLAYKTGGILTYLLMWYLFSIVITFIDLSYYGKGEVDRTACRLEFYEKGQ